VLVNGGLNLSELDGWWAEAYSPEVGWALGDGYEHDDILAWDATEAEALYSVLENEVIPEFYTRDKEGIPTTWVQKMRESMAGLTPRFSAARTVFEYTENHYLPAAIAYQERAANNGALGVKIINWKSTINKYWKNIRFGEVTIISDKKNHLFNAEVFLGELDPETVRVELFAEGTDRHEPGLIYEMSISKKFSEISGTYLYAASIPATRDANDYTPRILPFYPGVKVPLECNHILWKR
jgi:starch phosphorylase